jgi:hypothetical protein
VMTAMTTTASTTAATAAMMTPNGDKHNNKKISRHPQRGTWW